jgi:serine/threonine protein kinase
MNDFSHICPNCCRETADGRGYCAACGTNAASVKNAEFCVPAGSVLLDRYFIGKVIGQGGFGITYLGFDDKLKTKIAVKEFFPQGFAYREMHKDKHTVYSLTGEKTESFKRGLQKFITEARRLAQFSGSPGIVNVRDYFNENNTAYIVMEFVEGEPLEKVLKRKHKLTEAETTEIFLPILKTLQKVHAAGILHRDIAPDNIMVEPDGTARLIDFGASAEINENAATSTAILKHNYAPEEQYDSNRRRQGSWTDVYAISATVFRCLEGRTIPDAIERLRGETFEEFTVPVSEPVKAAVMHGLALFAKDRAQTVDELMAAFSGLTVAEVIQKRTSIYFNNDKKSTKKTKIIAGIFGGAAAIAAAVCLVIFLPRPTVPVAGEIETIETTETTVTTAETVAAAETSATQTTADTASSTTTTTITTTTTAKAATTTAATTTAAPETQIVVTTAPNKEQQNETTTAATTAKKLTDGYVKRYDYYVTIGIGPGKYTGDLKDGKPEGKGVYTAASGSYDGEWKNGLPNGQGKLVRNNNWQREYTGGFKDGKFDGFGIMIDEDKNTYEGEWKDGMKNGKGTEYPYHEGDEWTKSGKNFVKTGEFIDDHYVPNSEFEMIVYEIDGSIRTEYRIAAPSGDHFLGEWEGDPITTVHGKKVNPDGSIDEWDDVYVNGQQTEHINQKRTDPPQS